MNEHKYEIRVRCDKVLGRWGVVMFMQREDGTSDHQPMTVDTAKQVADAVAEKAALAEQRNADDERTPE